MNRDRARAAIFTVLLAWMVAGPFARQILNLPTPWLRDWGMFGNVGVRTIDVRVLNVSGGKVRRLHLQEVAQATEGQLAPYFTADSEVMNAARSFCSALGAGADVRAFTRRGVRHGWVPERTGSENLCAISGTR